jgi:TetR/AcrR family transcriptional repressor of nem operon
MEAIKTSNSPGPGRPARGASAARREHILNVGARIICEKGYHGTSIRDIVDAVGIPKGSFYNYFASKEEFVVEALEFHMGQRYREFTNALNDQSRSPVECIKRSFQDNPDSIATDEFTPMSLLTKLSTEVGSSIAIIDQTTRELFSRFRDSVAACISRAQEAGEIDADKDPVSLATFILFSWHGAMLYSRDQKDQQHPEPFYEVLERYLLV